MNTEEKVGGERERKKERKKEREGEGKSLDAEQ